MEIRKPRNSWKDEYAKSINFLPSIELAITEYISHYEITIYLAFLVWDVQFVFEKVKIK